MASSPLCLGHRSQRLLVWVVLLLCCSCAAAEPNEDSERTPERDATSQRGCLLQAAGLVVALISWNLNSFAPHVQEIESLKKSEGSVVLAAQEVRCTDESQQKNSAQLSSWCLEWGEPMPHAEREVEGKGRGGGRTNFLCGCGPDFVSSGSAPGRLKG